VGLALGAGVEKELNNPKWRARLEYLYEHFDGSETVLHGAPASGQTGMLEIDDAHKLRIAISRKFGRNN
jgi:opacity protein-like surface antigen